MKTVVAYESMYGNTQSIAQAIAEGLGSAAATGVVSAGDADQRDITGLDLLVVGGAHARPRDDAAANEARSGGGLPGERHGTDRRSVCRSARTA